MRVQGRRPLPQCSSPPPGFPCNNFARQWPLFEIPSDQMQCTHLDTSVFCLSPRKVSCRRLPVWFFPRSYRSHSTEVSHSTWIVLKWIWNCFLGVSCRGGQWTILRLQTWPLGGACEGLGQVYNHKYDLLHRLPCPTGLFLQNSLEAKVWNCNTFPL